MSVRIAIDASRTTVARLTGTEHYALRLIQSLIMANRISPKSFSLELYFRDTPDRDLFKSTPDVTSKVIPFPRAWTHWRFARELWVSRPDITFVPAHTLPFFFPGKSIVTVHDLGYKHFPDAHPFAQRTYLDLTTRYSQARATAILADSRATADDLTRFYGTPRDKIHVIYPGVDAKPLLETIQNVETIRAKYNLPERYFLFIGTLQPRKNIQRIVQAFARWQSKEEKNDTALVLAGGQGWLFDPSWVEGVENVILTGYIDEADKSTLLRGAIAIVFPTLHEGFGFPVIEAMHCGTPVIASNTSSLPELVGKAGLLVNPFDVSMIANAMRKYSNQPDLREQMIQAGHQQSTKFTWAQAAQDVMDVFQKIQN